MSAPAAEGGPDALASLAAELSLANGADSSEQSAVPATAEVLPASDATAAPIPAPDDVADDETTG